MTKKKKLVITNDDMKCLHTLWRWKFLTTTALHQACYSQRKIAQCYWRLWHLERNKLITSLSTWDRKAIVWHLADFGYEVIAPQISNIVQNGFRSEHKDHDFWVTAIHLGDWVNKIPENCELYSEQQLRRLATYEYEPWVPQSSQHRPDGWWKIGIEKPNDQSLIALEVEFSKKTPYAYNSVGDFYANAIDVYQVVWVVQTKGDINYILKHLKDGTANSVEVHSFILLDKYVQQQWQSEILVGKNQGKKLCEILSTSTQPDGSEGLAKVFLDVRKKPTFSRPPRLALDAEVGLSRQY